MPREKSYSIDTKQDGGPWRCHWRGYGEQIAIDGAWGLARETRTVLGLTTWVHPFVRVRQGSHAILLITPTTNRVREHRPLEAAPEGREQVEEQREPQFEGWVILELMGHRRLAGYLREQEIGGASFLRLDIPSADGEPAATQYYAPAAVYCITPTTEAMVKEIARINRPEPVTRWELRALPATAGRDDDDPIDLP